MSYWALIGSALTGLVIALAVIPLFLRIGCLRALLQRGRDLHHIHLQPVPRLGGLALVTAFLGVEAFMALACPEIRTKLAGRSLVILGSLAMFALGFWDDIKPVGAKRKLLVQVLIALAVCLWGVGIVAFKVPFTGTVISLGGWGMLLTVLWLVGMTNLINLIDGVDGLAGGICFMLMVLLAYVAHGSGSFECMTAGIAGALVAFLVFNFPPARVYLGDGGAYFLGFQIGLLAILNSHKGTVFVALVAPLFVLTLPILDTSLAILRRGLRGLPIFRPDRKHLHHRLLQMGLSRRRVVLWLYSLTLLFLLMGLAAYWSRGDLVPVLLSVGTVILLACAGKLSFSRRWFAVGQVVGESLSMRQEVQYAMSLTRWLELEGNRRGSADELWSDLIFAAQRLGYTSVKLKLTDGERCWGEPNGSQPVHSVVEVLEGGRLGTLELKAHAREAEGVGIRDQRQYRRPDCASIADGQVFEIVSELLAEGWIKAASKLAGDHNAPLRFSRGEPDTKDRAPESGEPRLYTAPAHGSSEAPLQTPVGAAR